MNTQDDDVDYVPDPGVIMKETTATLKELIGKSFLPAEVIKDTNYEIAVLEKNYAALVDTDFDFAHSNIKALIEKGTQTLTTILIAAGSSDHPGTYEVAIQLIKTLSDLNKDLFEVHERHEKVKTLRETKRSADAPQNNTQNNLFVGTPQEFLKMLRNGGKPFDS